MASGKLGPRGCRYASLQDLGYGIGQLSYNDLRVDLGNRKVREVIASDVCGRRRTRLDLDSNVLEPLSSAEGPGPWSANQIRRVTRACLEAISRDPDRPFGTISLSTSFGLWNGRKPGWLDRDRWEREKQTAARIASSPAPAPTCPGVLSGAGLEGFSRRRRRRKKGGR